MRAQATSKFFGKSRPRTADALQDQIYLSIMMMYLDPGLREIHYGQFALRMTDFMQSVADQRALAACIDISKDVMTGAYYRALRKARALHAFAGQQPAAGAA